MKKIDAPNRKYYYFVILLWIVSLVWGWWQGRTDQGSARDMFDQFSSAFGFLKGVPSSAIFIFIFLNNAVKAFFLILFGFFFGLYPLYFVFSNGQLIGLVTAFAAASTNSVTVLASLVPHGVFELSAITISAAYSFWLGYKFYKKIRHKEQFIPHLRQALVVYYRIVVPLLFVAALVEAYITPKIVELVQH